MMDQHQRKELARVTRQMIDEKDTIIATHPNPLSIEVVMAKYDKEMLTRQAEWLESDEPLPDFIPPEFQSKEELRNHILDDEVNRMYPNTIFVPPEKRG
jgi:hypothetical protein